MSFAVHMFSYLSLFALLCHPAFSQVFAALDGSVAGKIDPPPNLSPNCAATFNQSILCAPALLQASRGALPTPQDLDEICFENCRASLEALRASQIANCTAGDTIIGGDKILYPATYITDRLLYAYDWSCVKDSGEYCFPLAQQYSAGNVTSSSDLCSSCNLKTWQVLLTSPFGYSDESASNYSSLTSSCEVTSYPITSPTPYAVGTTTYSESSAPQTTTTGRVIPTPTCESKYTIQESDTCQSISLSKKVSTFYLTYSNKLPAFCTDFPGPGTELCIPQSCDTYTFSSMDTCDSLAKAKGVTVSEILDWNPNINPQCSNLRSLKGYVICLSEPGTVTSAAIPPPRKMFPAIPTSSNVTLLPPRPVNMSEVLYGTRTRSVAPAWTDPATLPLAPGTRNDCTRYDSYLEVPVEARYLKCCNPNYCFIKADFWGINETQLVEWNPSLRQSNITNGTAGAQCLFKEGYGYCVAA